ncbi:hypothetical protein SKM62_06610 [Acinetobacter faecalis]|uniref:hypothetical protein n=1 Tax=Acinetobacter faecalis TaxID=2665161 RepID=UPI002A91B8E4|nr:hypothetical protein [Acinetobacter faecalis]MDY6536600.1 hypothetical protein [Acinetobacter faecalis]
MAYFLGFLYIAAYIAIYLSLFLLPYYVAYSIIEPHSFLGVVGVLILGSVIVPLTLGLAFLVFGSFFVAFEKFKEKIAHNPHSQPLSPYSNENSPLDVTPKPEKRSSKDVVLFLFLGIGALAIILIFALNGPKETAEIPYHETIYDEESTDDASTPYLYSDTSNGEIEETYVDDSKIQDNYNYMIYAVDEFLKIMPDSGISGVARSVRDCYVDKEIDKLYCVYLDNTARLMDAAVSEQMGFNHNEYLSYDRVLARNYKYYYIPTNTSHLATDHQKTVESQLIRLLRTKVEAKNYNSENDNGVSTQNSKSHSNNSSYDSRIGVEMSENFNSHPNSTPEPEAAVGEDSISTLINNELEADYE